MHLRRRRIVYQIADHFKPGLAASYVDMPQGFKDRGYEQGGSLPPSVTRVPREGGPAAFNWPLSDVSGAEVATVAEAIAVSRANLALLFSTVSQYAVAMEDDSEVIADAIDALTKWVDTNPTSAADLRRLAWRVGLNLRTAANDGGPIAPLIGMYHQMRSLANKDEAIDAYVAAALPIDYVTQPVYGGANPSTRTYDYFRTGNAAEAVNHAHAEMAQRMGVLGAVTTWPQVVNAPDGTYVSKTEYSDELRRYCRDWVVDDNRPSGAFGAINGPISPSANMGRSFEIIFGTSARAELVGVTNEFEFAHADGQHGVVLGKGLDERHVVDTSLTNGIQFAWLADGRDKAAGFVRNAARPGIGDLTLEAGASFGNAPPKGDVFVNLPGTSGLVTAQIPNLISSVLGAERDFTLVVFAATPLPSFSDSLVATFSNDGTSSQRVGIGLSTTGRSIVYARNAGVSQLNNFGSDEIAVLGAPVIHRLGARFNETGAGTGTWASHRWENGSSVQGTNITANMPDLTGINRFRVNGAQLSGGIVREVGAVNQLLLGNLGALEFYGAFWWNRSLSDAEMAVVTADDGFAQLTASGPVPSSGSGGNGLPSSPVGRLMFGD